MPKGEGKHERRTHIRLLPFWNLVLTVLVIAADATGPSAQAEIQIDPKGRKRRLYKQWRTPLEKLLSLDQPHQFLRPGLSIHALQRVAGSMSDTEAAQRMQLTEYNLFEQIQRSA